MLSKDQFVAEVFRIAKEMSAEELWMTHVLGVDEKYIRIKNGKNVTAEMIQEMWPALLSRKITKAFANSVIGTATKNQSSVNVPMKEIVRRIRDQ